MKFDFYQPIKFKYLTDVQNNASENLSVLAIHFYDFINF